MGAPEPLCAGRGVGVMGGGVGFIFRRLRILERVQTEDQTALSHCPGKVSGSDTAVPVAFARFARMGLLCSLDLPATLLKVTGLAWQRFATAPALGLVAADRSDT